jgi:hypothetical protein
MPGEANLCSLRWLMQTAEELAAPLIIAPVPELPLAGGP